MISNVTNLVDFSLIEIYLQYELKKKQYLQIKTVVRITDVNIVIIRYILLATGRES